MKQLAINITSLFVTIFLLFYSGLSDTVGQSIKETDSERLYKQARQLESSENYEAALDIYRQLWGQRPGDMTHYRGVKTCLLKLNMFNAAIAAINEMKGYSKSYYIDADLGEAYFLKGNKDQALEIWYNIIYQNKSNRSVYQAVANSMISNKLFDEAVVVYQQALKNIKSHNTSFLLDLAHLYDSRLDYKEATQLYIEYLKKEPAQYSYIEGQISRLAKDIEEPELIIDILKRNGVKSTPTLKRLLAGLYVQNSDYINALNEYSSLDRELNQNDETGKLLYEFAYTALKDGESDFSEEAFKRFIKRYPGSEYVSRARSGLAEAAFRRGNFEDAVEYYKKIISEYRSTVEARKAYLRLGQIYLTEFNQADSAKHAFGGIINNFPQGNEYFEALYYVGCCEVIKNDLQKAREWYHKVEENDKASSEIRERALYKLALIDIWEGSFDDAEKHLAKILETQPAGQKQRSGFFVNDALSLSLFINEYRQSADALTQYTKYLLLIEQNQLEKAIAGLRKMLTVSSNSIMGDIIYMSIAEQEHKLGHYERAIETYRKLLAEYPDSDYIDAAQNRIAEIFEKDLNDFISAIKEYEIVLVNFPESMLLEEVRQKIRDLENRGSKGKK